MYLLDTNVFITAKNTWYGFDLCPGFWTWLDHAHAKGVVGSIEAVCDELTQGDDRLAQWAQSRRGKFFRQPEPEVLPALGAVSQWTMAADYTPAAKDQFFQVADYHLVTTALASDHTVVTLEVAQGAKRRVKIPDVCVGLRVKQVQVWTMLTRERARFV